MVAEVLNDEAWHVEPDKAEESEILLEPSTTPCVEEAMFVQHSTPEATIRSRLALLVRNTRPFRKSQPLPKPPVRHRHFPNPSETWREPTPAADLPGSPGGLHHDFETAWTRDVATTLVALQAKERVLAILDTGASRCVMGADLVPRFLEQLGQQVRGQIRVVRAKSDSALATIRLS